MSKNLTPHEDKEQEAVVQYLEAKKLKFTAIPNSTYTKSFKQKMKNKRIGLRAGLPDLLIIIKNKLVFIEMKRQKGSTTSYEQKEWIKALNNISPSIEAHICYGASEAIDLIKLIFKK